MIEVGRTAREAALFCSDMHLGDHDARTGALFLERLDAHAHRASHLFLLGDLFEAWVGDDQPDAVAQALLDRLKQLAAAGTRIFAMRGNRDFLLDVAFPADAATRPAHSFGERSGAISATTGLGSASLRPGWPTMRAKVSKARTQGGLASSDGGSAPSGGSGNCTTQRNPRACSGAHRAAVVARTAW